MTLPATINITTAFRLDLATPVFNIKDLTPFNTEGITLNNVKGNFKIVNPIGITVYENTSTSTPDLNNFSITGITQVAGLATAISATAHGMLTGDWVLVGGAGQAGYNILAQITKVNATTFTYAVASGTVTPATGTLRGLKASLNTISIPLDSSTGMPIPGDYTITLTTIVAGGTQPGTYEKEFTYTYSYIRPSVTITQSVNCFLARFISTDTTTYMVNAVQPTLTRTHNITYPADSDIPVETYVTQTVTVNAPKVWNGIFTTSIRSTLEYVFTDSLVIDDKVSGAQSFTVACDVNGCQMNCCINTLNQQYILQLATNPTLAAQTRATLDRAVQLRDLFIYNQQCGNTDEMAQNLALFYEVTQCSPDCSCGETGQVVPYEGYIGKTILFWDINVPNSKDDIILYLFDLYLVLANTTAGQNPTDNPSLFQVIGA